MTVEFDSHHENPTDSQLLVALTGSPAFIKEALWDLASEISSNYGKPVQGRVGGDGEKHVITPVWKGREYL